MGRGRAVAVWMLRIVGMIVVAGAVLGLMKDAPASIAMPIVGVGSSGEIGEPVPRPLRPKGVPGLNS